MGLKIRNVNLGVQSIKLCFMQDLSLNIYDIRDHSALKMRLRVVLFKIKTDLKH